jgi:hypothetical protein
MPSGVWRPSRHRRSKPAEMRAFYSGTDRAAYDAGRHHLDNPLISPRGDLLPEPRTLRGQTPYLLSPNLLLQPLSIVPMFDPPVKDCRIS